MFTIMFYFSPSSESNVYAPYSKILHSSVAKLERQKTNHFDMKQDCVPQHVKHSELSTVCSSIETLKSTSDQSVKYKN